MGLGKRKDVESSFLPIAKYDTPSGRLTLHDRAFHDGGWHTNVRDVTEMFSAVFDLEHVQRGWIRFTPAPEMVMVPVGEDPGEAPSDEYKEGLRLLMALPPELGGGVRELTSTALTFWFALDELHDEYLAAVATEHPHELPLVELVETRRTEGQQVNYAPVFRIKAWVKRPPELKPSLAHDTVHALTNGKGKKPTPDEHAEVPF